MRRILHLILLCLFLFSSDVLSGNGGISLDIPVKCNPGVDCFIQNYFDHDQGSAARDYTCGPLTYDGHRGTDFRIADLEDMRKGVEVLAAAPGVVAAVRDGREDVKVEKGCASVKGVEAGNAVRIVHGGGWETQYSHLRKGSVAVKPGQKVEAGRKLGLIGLSGCTEFPHVDFSVRYNDKTLDPFVGMTEKKGCPAGLNPLWSERALKKLEYVPGGLLKHGFSGKKPTADEIFRGEAGIDEIASDAKSFYYWMSLFGLRKGDERIIRLIGADGRLMAEDRKVVSSDMAVYAGTYGLVSNGASWERGEIRAELVVLRPAEGKQYAVVRAEAKLKVY